MEERYRIADMFLGKLSDQAKELMTDERLAIILNAADLIIEGDLVLDHKQPANDDEIFMLVAYYLRRAEDLNKGISQSQQ